MRALMGFVMLAQLTVACAHSLAKAKLLVAEENKAIARRLFDEVLGQGKKGVCDAIHTDDFVSHTKSKELNKEDNCRAKEEWGEAFPDQQVEIRRVFAEGSHVVVHWSMRGTNTGAAHGLNATKKRIHGDGMTILRIEDGKIAEEWTASSWRWSKPKQ